ncbi:MAG TPA: cytochrome D ubiquinol oxidase subunit II, partial [Candidatus Binatia bacterium]|nr:cytochrome D ubiquinol oxidase subunit II [Candidatus Binatia bacterium]
RDHLLRNGFISPEDLDLYKVTDDIDEAVRMITRFYRNYHSMRFVHELLVIRLKHAPSQSAIDGLNQDFADIIMGDKVQAIEPTPEEREDNAYLDLPRIAFGFNRRDYGRLRQMIDVLNSF